MEHVSVGFSILCFFTSSGRPWYSDYWLLNATCAYDIFLPFRFRSHSALLFRAELLLSAYIIFCVVVRRLRCSALFNFAVLIRFASFFTRCLCLALTSGCFVQTAISVNMTHMTTTTILRFFSFVELNNGDDKERQRQRERESAKRWFKIQYKSKWMKNMLSDSDLCMHKVISFDFFLFHVFRSVFCAHSFPIHSH